MKMLTPQDLRCPVSGKTAYVNFKRADDSKGGGKPFKCGDCGWFHKTQPKRQPKGAT